MLFVGWLVSFKLSQILQHNALLPCAISRPPEGEHCVVFIYSNLIIAGLKFTTSFGIQGFIEK